MTRAHTRGGEDPDGGPHRHPSSGQGLHMLYCQLAESHVIMIAQLAECACRYRADSTSSPVQARASWQMPATEPSTARVSSPPVGLPTQARPGNRACAQPKRHMRNPRQGRHSDRKGHRTTFLGTPPRRCTTSLPSTPTTRRQPNFSLSHAAGKRP
jgi:hypothetical protein